MWFLRLTGLTTHNIPPEIPSAGGAGADVPQAKQGQGAAAGSGRHPPAQQPAHYVVGVVGFQLSKILSFLRCYKFAANWQQIADDGKGAL